MSYIARRKNRVLRIPEDSCEEYAKMGYEVIEENGAVVHEAEVTTSAEAMAVINALRKKMEAKTAENVALQEKCEKADKEIKALKAKIAKAGKTNPAEK